MGDVACLARWRVKWTYDNYLRAINIEGARREGKCLKALQLFESVSRNQGVGSHDVHLSARRKRAQVKRVERPNPELLSNPLSHSLGVSSKAAPKSHRLPERRWAPRRSSRRRRRAPFISWRMSANRSGTPGRMMDAARRC